MGLAINAYFCKAVLKATTPRFITAYIDLLPLCEGLILTMESMTFSVRRKLIGEGNTLRNPFFIIVLFIGTFPSLHGQIIWQEDFSSYPNGTQNSAMWTTVYNDCDDGTINMGQNYWGVFNGEFLVNDIEGFNCTDEGSGPGGNNQNILTTTTIDISSYGCVEARVSLDLDSGTSYECGFPSAPSTDPVGAYNGHDQMTVEYAVNGGAWTLFAVNGYVCGENNIPGTAIQGNITGNTLQIRITAGNQANQEEYTFDDIIVENTSIPYSLPSFPDICEADAPVSLPTDISGISGTWSGPGVNVAGNSFDPSIGSGPYDITFNPDLGTCASPASTTITVTAATNPNVLVPPPLCETQADFNLPVNVLMAPGPAPASPAIPSTRMHPMPVRGPIRLPLRPIQGNVLIPLT